MKKTNAQVINGDHRNQYEKLTQSIGPAIEELPPSYDEMIKFLRNSIADEGDDEGRAFLLAFAGFKDFFEWLDAASHYDQADCAIDLAEHSSWVNLAYKDLVVEFQAAGQEPFPHYDPGF